MRSSDLRPRNTPSFKDMSSDVKAAKWRNKYPNLLLGLPLANLAGTVPDNPVQMSPCRMALGQRAGRSGGKCGPEG